jgi:hypothetical protein
MRSSLKNLLASRMKLGQSSNFLRIGVSICLIVISFSGCESFQKKFVRKKDYKRPSPIISFQDYTRSMTPLDRYQKHYAIFDYWNSQLLDEMASGSFNPKRAQHASNESLQELKLMRSLLQDSLALELGPAIDWREQLNQQLKSGTFNTSQITITQQRLASDTSKIQRGFYWRKVEDKLKDAEWSKTEENLSK